MSPTTDAWFDAAHGLGWTRARRGRLSAAAHGAWRDRPPRVSADYPNIRRAEIATVHGTVDGRRIGTGCRRLLARHVA